MIYYEFESSLDEERGFLGWKLKGNPSMDPVEGFGVAHDIMEHSPEDRGDVHEEFKAFGAMARTRGLYYNNRSLLYLWAGSLSAEVYPYYVKNGQYVLPPPKGVTNTAASAYIEEDAEEAVEQATLHLEEWHDPDLVKEMLTHFVYWARVGYAEAKERYKDAPQATLIALFKEIEAEADSYLRDCEGMEGYTLKVAFEARQAHADLELHYPEYA